MQLLHYLIIIIRLLNLFPRNEQPESEPLSEFTEGPMSFTMLPAPFRQIQSSPLAMRSQRAVYQEIRSTPYNHPPNVYLPTVPPQLLLPSSSSHNFSTNYNPDQSFIMHSTAPPVARGLIAVEEKRTSPTFDSSPIAKSNKSIGQGSKIKV